VARLLIDHVQRLVPREALAVAAGLDVDGRSLDTIVHRIRVRLLPLGWTVIGIRSRGYVLAPTDDEDGPGTSDGDAHG
jgi:DNA-binding response OmpR family regulator